MKTFADLKPGDIVYQLLVEPLTIHCRTVKSVTPLGNGRKIHIILDSTHLRLGLAKRSQYNVFARETSDTPNRCKAHLFTDEIDAYTRAIELANRKVFNIKALYRDMKRHADELTQKCIDIYNQSNTSSPTTSIDDIIPF